jgi:Cu-Zn family superoxide dismutase
LLKLTGKEGSIVGRSVILHALPDNCTGPDGHAGPRLAQCVIGISNVDDNMACFEEEVMTAVAELTPTTHCEEHCSGTVWFFQMHNSVEVIAKVKGLEKDSVHGFHIHQYGDLRDEEGLSAGEHFNPNGRKHNLPPHTPRHMGDLGNIQSYDDEGHAWYRFFDHNIKDLSMLVGRGVIVHSDDDHGSGYLCDESGDSGNRLLMGVIGVAHPGTKAPTIPEDVDINNHWESSSCEDIVLDDHKGHSKGLVAALIVGWAIAGLLLLVVLPGLSIYYNRRLRHRYDTLGTIPE